MNARIVSPLLLLPNEALAHLTIVDTLDKAHDNVLDYHQALNIIWRPLETFAPRCNCRRVLKFGPWRDGSRIAACSCGVTFMECDIRHGRVAL